VLRCSEKVTENSAYSNVKLVIIKKE